MEAPASVHVDGAENPIYLGPVHAVLTENLSSADEKNEVTTGGTSKTRNMLEISPNSPRRQENVTRAALGFENPTSNYEHQVFRST